MNGQARCKDYCYANRCPSGQVCAEQAVECVSPPCDPVVQCGGMKTAGIVLIVPSDSSLPCSHFFFYLLSVYHQDLFPAPIYQFVQLAYLTGIDGIAILLLWWQHIFIWLSVFTSLILYYAQLASWDDALRFLGASGTTTSVQEDVVRRASFSSSSATILTRNAHSYQDVLVMQPPRDQESAVFGVQR